MKEYAELKLNRPFPRADARSLNKGPKAPEGPSNTRREFYRRENAVHRSSGSD